MSLQKDDTVTWSIDGYDLEISNPQKMYWPKEGITKLDVLNYYKSMATVLLPYFKYRPATLHYYPRGIEEFSFYKRDFKDIAKNEKLFHTAFYKEISQDKTIKVPLIDSAAGLLWFASHGGFEFHLWSSTMPNYAKPDIAIFDLDAYKKTPFKHILKAAKYLNELLDSMNLKGYAKTSGGTGMHIYVPIIAKYSFENVREWVKSVNVKLEKQYPELITTQRKGGKTHISNKISIDYLQNVVSRNTIAPYSLRGYSGATVSTPLSWEEIEKGGFYPKDFNIKNVPKRIEKFGNLFSGVLINKEPLPI